MTTARKLLATATVVALVQIGFLASALYSRASLLRNGQELTLRTQPIDPRDLLRGDYVSLSYDVSRVPTETVRTQRPRDDKVVGTVYVRLRRDLGPLPASIVATGLGAPVEGAPGENEIDLKGESRDRWQEGLQTINVLYGLERFYVPEGEGRAIEQGLRERQFTMRVAVGKSGEAQIKALYDGDTALYSEPLY